MLFVSSYTPVTAHSQVKEVAVKVTKGTANEQLKKLVYFMNADSLKISYFKMQKLDNGYTRFKVKYSGVPMRNIMIFDSPNGDILRLTSTTKKNGAGVLTFDIKNSKLKKIKELTINFYDDSNRDYVWVDLDENRQEKVTVGDSESGMVNQGEEVLVSDNPTDLPTDGKIVGKGTKLKYGYDKKYFTQISITEWKLDNGYRRYRVEYVTKDCRVTAVRGESYGNIDYLYENPKLKSGEGYCIIDVKETYIKEDKKENTGTCLGLYAHTKSGELVEMHFVPGDAK